MKKLLSLVLTCTALLFINTSFADTPAQTKQLKADAPAPYSKKSTTETKQLKSEFHPTEIIITNLSDVDLGLYASNHMGPPFNDVVPAHSDYPLINDRWDGPTEVRLSYCDDAGCGIIFDEEVDSHDTIVIHPMFSAEKTLAKTSQDKKNKANYSIQVKKAAAKKAEK